MRDISVDNSIFGADANDYALGIELCFFSDVERTKKAYSNYVEYLKKLNEKYKLPVTSHIAHKTLDPTRRNDPLNAFKLIGKTWEDFVKDLGDTGKEAIKNQIIELIKKL